jgi:hypothetical protein
MDAIDTAAATNSAEQAGLAWKDEECSDIYPDTFLRGTSEAAAFPPADMLFRNGIGRGAEN